MGDFKRLGNKGGDTWNRGPGGKPGFGSRPGFSRPAEAFGGTRNHGDDRPREMFKAVCAECGRPTEVPFKPSGERPVYCKECFQAMGPQERSEQRRDPRFAPRRDAAPRRDFSPRPSFAPAQGSGEDKRLDDLKIQLATAISKLDKLINLMVNNTAHTAPKTAPSKSESLHDMITKVVPNAMPDAASAVGGRKDSKAKHAAKKKATASKKK